MKKTVLAITLILTLFSTIIVAQQVSLTEANFNFMKSWYCDISIHSPQHMITYDTGNILLNFTVETNFHVPADYERYAYCYFYSIDEQDVQSSVKIDDVEVVSKELITNDTILDYTHTILKGQTNFHGLSSGLHSIKIFAGYLYINGTIEQVSSRGSNPNSSSTAWFSVGTAGAFTASSSISEPIFMSPQNKTYNQLDLPLDFSVNEPTSWMGYSLDNGANVTLMGNTTLTLKEGVHTITLYANDTAGNMGASETVYFTVEQVFTIIPIATGVAIIALVSAGLLFYFKKRKH